MSAKLRNVLVIIAIAAVGGGLGALADHNLRVRTAPTVRAYRDSLAACRDSLATVRIVRDSVKAQHDSLLVRYEHVRALYTEQLTLYEFARERSLYYARVVVNRPESLRYLIGWLTRTFDQSPPAQ